MVIKDLQYNVETEVTENQYKKVMSDGAGICAGRIDNNRYYIKLWMPKYKNFIIQLINSCQ